MTSPRELPPWADYVLLPLLNLAAALVLSGLVVIAVGEDPLLALATLVDGVVGDPEGIGYTLYYATTFMFTGLAVAIPFHAGLFNIGGEGQAILGGLGAALVCLALGAWPLWLVLPLAIAASAGLGAAWAFIPAYLQARRGSHVVMPRKTDAGTTTVPVPDHSELKIGTLLSIIRQSGLQRSEFES